VPTSKSSARHRTASNSPTLKPVAAISSTIVLYGSSTSLKSFAKSSPAMIPGAITFGLLRELHPARRIHRQVAVLDRRLEDP
jgi:hypothetical protein